MIVHIDKLFVDNIAPMMERISLWLALFLICGLLDARCMLICFLSIRWDDSLGFLQVAHIVKICV